MVRHDSYSSSPVVHAMLRKQYRGAIGTRHEAANTGSDAIDGLCDGRAGWQRGPARGWPVVAEQLRSHFCSAPGRVLHAESCVLDLSALVREFGDALSGIPIVAVVKAVPTNTATAVIFASLPSTTSQSVLSTVTQRWPSFVLWEINSSCDEFNTLPSVEVVAHLSIGQAPFVRRMAVRMKAKGVVNSEKDDTSDGMVQGGLLIAAQARTECTMRTRSRRESRCPSKTSDGHCRRYAQQ